MKSYLNSLMQIKNLGTHKGDRTGTGTQSYFGQQERYNLRDNNLPVVTTKKVHLHSVIHELIWMLSGDTRVDYLIRNNVRIWNEWVKPETAVYEPMTSDEMMSKVKAHIGCAKDDKFVMAFESGEVIKRFQTIGEYFANVHEDAIDDVMKNFWNMYPDIRTDEDRASVSHVISVNVVEWKTVTNDLNKLNPESEADYDVAFGRVLYKIVTGQRPEKLISGDLGPVYGKTWRDIEDIRIVPKLEWADFEKRGFEFVVDIPGTEMKSDRCVIKRNIDQVQDVIDQLRNNPDSRRIIICAWDPRLVEDQALPPCHSFIQFWTRELTLEERVQQLDHMTEFEERYQLEVNGQPTRGKPPFQNVEGLKRIVGIWHKDVELTDEWVGEWLDKAGIPRRAISCQLYQRSVDSFLGKPFNITFYSLLTHMLANQLNMVADEFVWTGGDTHIYSNHQEQTDLQLTRDPLPTPTIRFKPTVKGLDIRELNDTDFEILGYEAHAHIAGKVAV